MEWKSQQDGYDIASPLLSSLVIWLEIHDPTYLAVYNYTHNG